MAYELTCPHCGAVVKSPFVRVGAVTTCGQCSTRYCVREEGIRRPSATAPADADPAVVLLDEDEADTAETGDPGATDATGLSGLSTLMREQDAVADTAEGDALPPAAPPTPAARQRPAGAAPRGRATADASRATRGPQRRRKQQIGLLVGISIIAALLFVGLMILVILMPEEPDPPRSIDDPGPTAEAPEPDDPTPDPEPSPPDPEPTDALSPDEPPAVAADPPDPAPTPPAPLPRVEAVSLLPSDWRRYEPPVFLPPETDDPVRVKSARIVEQADGRAADVTVISDTLMLIDQATLTVALTDEAGQASMAFAVPVSLLEPLTQRTYQVTLPADAPGDPTLRAQVKLRRAVDQAFGLMGVSVQPTAEDGRPKLRLYATTPEEARIDEAVFTITARDDRGDQPSAAWRCTVPGPFAGGTSIRAIATLPEEDASRLTSPGQTHWSATAVGLE
jgi:hypothetical protein